MDQDSKDANSLLVELDRALQSQNVGDQSEAVARFTSLFQRCALPILIDSACLKLSEAFKFCSNFIRIQICEVFERNQSHLNKIYNVDMFYRNIFTVTTSNDPIARSITLLALGKIAPIVNDHKMIHHCISDSLDSNFDCELKGAISCAASYVKESSEFACNIYPKIVSIIDSDKSSTEIKVRALSVLDHGFYNANDAMNVRSFLIRVIEQTKLKKLICSCLTLSTKISFSSLTPIKPQIELLLKTYLTETATAIKVNALWNLRFLAEKSPHIWETSHTIPLISHLEQSLATDRVPEEDRAMHIILSIFCKLQNCKCNFISSQEKTRIFQQCYKLALSDHNIPLRSMAFELLAVMYEERLYSTEKSVVDESKELSIDTFRAIETFIDHSLTKKKSRKVDLGKNVQANDSKVKSIYRHIEKLCQLNPHYSQDLLQLCYDRLSKKDSPLNDLCPYLTELMCAIHQSMNKTTITPENLWKLIKTRHSELSDKNLLNLSTLYFQALRITNHGEVPESFVEKLSQDHGVWFRFKIMRQAMRYGHYKVAALFCTGIHDELTSDTVDFYFKGLGRICAAEAILSSKTNLDANLKAGLPLYEQAVSPLRASVCNSRLTNFQLQYLWLRIRTLQVHVAFRQCCKMHDLSPMTYSSLLNAIGVIRGGPDLGWSKLGIIQQMHKIAKDFRHVSECYENLSLVSFDCDDQTLNYIILLKSSCILMADAIDAIFQYGKNLPVLSKITHIHDDTPLALEYRETEVICNKLISSIKANILEPGLSPSDESIEPLINHLKSISDDLLKSPFMYPRYFFQSLQKTQIKLAITPQPSTSSGSITVLQNYNLVLKVEGLIQNLSKTQVVIREVSKVLVSVKLISAKHTEINGHLFVQSVATPHSNYFKTEFLLPLKWQGCFNVDIDVSIIDKLDRTWKTGPTERLNLTVS